MFFLCVIISIQLSVDRAQIIIVQLLYMWTYGNLLLDHPPLNEL